MNAERRKFYNYGLSQLPKEFIKKFETITGKNGETLFYDEAEVWKRVLNYRISNYIKDAFILETHAGKGLSTYLYQYFSDSKKIISCQNWEIEINKFQKHSFDIIDIDPFGHPYKCIEKTIGLLKDDGILMISNSDILSVVRNLQNTLFLKSDYIGIRTPKWVKEVCIPYIESITNLECQFFYAFPTTLRLIMCKNKLPETIFSGCEKWMWWLKKYANA